MEARKNLIWQEKLEADFTQGIAHAFTLHFNVRDYAIPGYRVKEYLGEILASRYVVAYYNPAQGIHFRSRVTEAETVTAEKMQERFTRLVMPEQGSQADDPLAGLLGGGAGSPQGELPRNPAQALPLLEKLLTVPEVEENGRVYRAAAVIIDFAEALAPAADIAAMGAADRAAVITLARWGTDPLIAAAGNPVIMLVENLAELHPLLRAASSKWEAIEVKLPDTAARKTFIDFYLADEPEFTLELEPQQLAYLTAGLSLVHIEDIFLRAASEGSLTMIMVRERKAAIIRSEFGDVLEIVEVDTGFEMVGGLQHVKDFFARSVIKPMATGNRERVPMGVLLTGAAGTGKSIIAEGLAKECGVNFINLNLANIFGQYVGMSERNLEKALRAIGSLAPCIVFMDEIDQAMSRGESGDSGVGSRVFKRLLEFMADTKHRGSVVFLAATNRPDLMDAALRRPGRFDKKIPFLVPDEAERKAILEVMAKKYKLGKVTIPKEVITSTGGWTGAELEAMAVKAYELTIDERLTAAKALEAASKRLSPSTSDIEFMTWLAVKECNDADLLPANYKQYARDKATVDEKLAATQPAKRGKREL